MHRKQTSTLYPQGMKLLVASISCVGTTRSLPVNKPLSQRLNKNVEQTTSEQLLDTLYSTTSQFFTLPHRRQQSAWKRRRRPEAEML